MVTSRTVSVGQVAQAGAEMLRLLRQGRVEWRAEVPEAQLGLIKTGQSVSISSADGTLFAGKVRTVAPTVQTGNRTALIYADITSGTARPGMFARGTIDKRLAVLVAVTTISFWEIASTAGAGAGVGAAFRAVACTTGAASIRHTSGPIWRATYPVRANIFDSASATERAWCTGWVTMAGMPPSVPTETPYRALICRNASGSGAAAKSALAGGAACAGMAVPQSIAAIANSALPVPRPDGDNLANIPGILPTDLPLCMALAACRWTIRTSRGNRTRGRDGPG